MCLIVFGMPDCKSVVCMIKVGDCVLKHFRDASLWDSISSIALAAAAISRGVLLLLTAVVQTILEKCSAVLHGSINKTGPRAAGFCCDLFCRACGKHSLRSGFCERK